MDMKSTKHSKTRRLFADVAASYLDLSEFNRHCTAALTLADKFGQQDLLPSAESAYYSALL
jgi:hypothetical protein